MDESYPRSSTPRDEVLTPSCSSESISQRGLRRAPPGDSTRRATATKSSKRRPESEDVATRSSADAAGFVSTDETSMSPFIVTQDLLQFAKSSVSRKARGSIAAAPTTHGERRPEGFGNVDVARSGSSTTVCDSGRLVYAEGREKKGRPISAGTGRHIAVRGRTTADESFAVSQAATLSSSDDIEGQRIIGTDAVYPKSTLFGRLSFGIGSIARRLFRSSPPRILPRHVRGNAKMAELGLLTSLSGRKRTMRSESQGVPFEAEGKAARFRLGRNRRNHEDDTFEGSQQDLRPLYRHARLPDRYDRRDAFREDTETISREEVVAASPEQMAASDKPKRATLEAPGARRPSFAAGQGDIQRQENQGTRATPKVRGGRFDTTVMTAAGESIRRQRKESERPQRRKHRSKEGDERDRTRSSSSRGHSGSNGEHRRKRKSRSHKRDGDRSSSRKEFSDDVPGSTYEMSGSPFRSFDFVISPVPVTRGALPRPELTRSCEDPLESNAWLVDPDAFGSPEGVTPVAKSSMRDPFAPSRKHENREVNIVSASPQRPPRKKHKRSSRRSSKKKASRSRREAELIESPTDDVASPTSVPGSGGASPQQRSEWKSKHRSRSKSKRKSREKKEKEAREGGEQSPEDKEKRRKSKRKSREHEADKGAREESRKKRKRKSREDRALKDGEESPKERTRRSKRKSREHRDAGDESFRRGEERKKSNRADEGGGEKSPNEREERRSKRKSREAKETTSQKGAGEESPEDREERKSKRRSRHSKRKESPEHSGKSSPRGERKKHRRHRKHDRDRKRGRRQKKYTPEGAPGKDIYYFQWDTADIPGIAGVHRDFSFSTLQMEGLSPIGSPGSPTGGETDTLPFDTFSTSTLPRKKRPPSSGRRDRKSRHRSTSSRSERSSKRGKHHRRHRGRGRHHGHRHHRSRKDKEAASSRSASAKASLAESRSLSRPTSPAGPTSPTGHISPASPSGMISPASPSSGASRSRESLASPERSTRKPRHHRHGKKHRHGRAGHSPRHKRHSRASERSGSKHRRSETSGLEREKDGIPRSAEISSVSPGSTEFGGSKHRKRSRSHRSRSRSRSRSHRSGRSRHGSKKKHHRRREHASAASRRSKERSVSPTRSPESPGGEGSTEMRGREGKIKRSRSRTSSKSGSRHSRKSRSGSSRGSRSRSPTSISRSRSSEGMVDKRSKKRHHHRRSESRGSRRSRSERSRESRRTSRRSVQETSSHKRHKRKKRHHRHRKGHGKSHHRKSRTVTASGSGRAGKKRVDIVAESYVAQSTPAYLCLLMSSLAATLTMVTCVLMVYYIITCKKQVANPSPTLFSGTTSQSKPWHEPTAPDVFPTSPKPIQVYYCTTDQCKREARYIARLLSHQVRPCDNFYKHVCNIWMSEHPAHALSTGSVVSRDTLLVDSIARQLAAVVSSASQRDIKVAANLYNACAGRRRSSATSKDAVGALFSRWNIEKWPRTAAVENVMAVWTFAAEVSRDLNVATLLRASVATDPENVDVTAIELSQPRCLYARLGQDNREAEQLLRAAVREAATELGVTGAAADALGNQLWSACTAIAAACRIGYWEDRVTVVKFGELKHLGLQTFLTVLLDGGISGSDDVVLHSVHNFLRELKGALHTLPPLDVLNYLGFLAIVHVAPFLPDELRDLRRLFTEARLGRTVGDATDTALLCTRLVERALPGCFAKAAHMWRLSKGQEMEAREWLTQLESVFLRHVAEFPWLSELSSLFIRYRVKRRALTQFGQPPEEHEASACAPLDDRLSVDRPLLFFADVSRRRQAQRFRELRGDSALLRRRAVGSEFSTEASFRRSLRVVHVPAALFNASVPSNSSSFVFHLARVAVRFYQGLVQLLYQDPYERDVPLSFTEDSRAKLEALLSCFDGDVQSSLDASTASPDSVSQLRRAFLDRTSALLLALKAFEELLPVRRIWNLDLRLSGLEGTSARQLFFIYFALDNCESRAPGFHKSSMSAEDRVNAPLKHIKQFAEAYQCRAQDPMVSPRRAACSVMRRG